MLPAATFRLLEPLLILMVKAEKALGVEVCVCVHMCIYTVSEFSSSHITLLYTPTPTRCTYNVPYHFHAQPLIHTYVHTCFSNTHTHTLINSVSHLSHPQLGSPFREPVMKFALKFPHQTVEFFLSHLAEPPISSVFHFFLGHKEGGPLRERHWPPVPRRLFHTHSP